MQADLGAAAILGAVFLANIGLIFGAFISMKVTITRLGVLVDILNRDVNNLGNSIREVTKKVEEIKNA